MILWCWGCESVSVKGLLRSKWESQRLELKADKLYLRSKVKVRVK